MNGDHFIEGDRVRLRHDHGGVSGKTLGTVFRAWPGCDCYTVQFDGYPESSDAGADDLELQEP